MESDLQDLVGWRGGPRGVIKGYRTAITLVLLSIWCHRNDVVFNGATPSTLTVLHSIREEMV